MPNTTAEVEKALETASGIAWDTCHKIYILMDDNQMALMKSYGYEAIVPSSDPSFALETVRDWWDSSCGLRLISTVSTVADGGDPNDGFTSIARQFEGWNEEMVLG